MNEKKTFEPHEIKHAMNTLLDAEMVKQDPHLMKHVSKHIKKHKMAITSLNGLRAKYNDLNSDEQAEGDELPLGEHKGKQPKEELV